MTDEVTVEAVCSLQSAQSPHSKFTLLSLRTLQSARANNSGLTTITNLLKTPRLSFWKDFVTVALRLTRQLASKLTSKLTGFESQ